MNKDIYYPRADISKRQWDSIGISVSILPSIDYLLSRKLYNSFGKYIDDSGNLVHGPCMVAEVVYKDGATVYKHGATSPAWLPTAYVCRKTRCMFHKEDI